MQNVHENENFSILNGTSDFGVPVEGVVIWPFTIYFFTLGYEMAVPLCIGHVGTTNVFKLV